VALGASSRAPGRAAMAGDGVKDRQRYSFQRRWPGVDCSFHSGSARRLAFKSSSGPKKSGQSMLQMGGAAPAGKKIAVPELIGARNHRRSHGSVFVRALRPCLPVYRRLSRLQTPYTHCFYLCRALSLVAMSLITKVNMPVPYQCKLTKN
jgi:hypothetical protein